MLVGKDRNKTGKVIAVFSKSETVIIEGLNMVKRHLRPRKQGQKGQIITRERAVRASSVALICKACGKQTRVGYRMEGEQKVRICRKCKAET